MEEKLLVIHLIRRYLHYTATFIGTQLISHERYEGVVVFMQKINNTLFHLPGSYPCFKGTGLKDAYGWFIYKYFRVLSKGGEKTILKLIEEKKPKVLHFHFGTDAVMYHHILKKSKVPGIVSFYGWDYSSFPKKWGGLGKMLLQKRVFRHASLILAMSENMKGSLIRLGCPPEKIKVHYYGIDTSRFCLKRDYTDQGPVKLRMLSSFELQKGQMFLLEAFHKAQQNCPIPMQLFFAGDGSQKEKFLKHLKKGAYKNVFVEDKYEYGSQAHLKMLEETDIFIHPGITAKNGKKEGIPGSLVEAMCSGLPVISTFHAGIPEIIADGVTGLLVREWDIEALSQAIILLASKAKLRESIGLAAQEYVIGNCDMKQANKKLEAIYSSLQDKNK